MRRTKIIATYGPACHEEAVLDRLIAGGVDIFRLNFSHGTHESHAQAFARIRAAAERHGRLVAIMQDLSGPKIRTGKLEGGQPLSLRAGDVLRIEAGDGLGRPGLITTAYAALVKSVKPGDRLLLDDGKVELRVSSTDAGGAQAVVVHGGPLAEHKGINAPGVALPPSAITAKDVEDLKFGMTLGVDFVAVSFVQTAADLRRAQQVMSGEGRIGCPIVAKLERPEAIEHLDEILEACDAVMVARGDLGLEAPLAEVPRLQKEITRRARAHGTPVIVATQVLESMRTEPRPTRAEVSDAANAVNDGVDAIMLSGETAAGAFPVHCVRMLASVIEAAEQMPCDQWALAIHDREHARALCEAAVTLARIGQADAIVAVTRAGTTAKLLSAMRPDTRIVAATDRHETARTLTILRGVSPIVTTIGADVDSTSVGLEHLLVGNAAGLVPGDVVVFVAVNPDLSRRNSNFLKLHRLSPPPTANP